MAAVDFDVLTGDEVRRIHDASMTILSEIGIHAPYDKALDLFEEAGASVDRDLKVVRIPEKLITWAADQAPKSFEMYGRDGSFCLPVAPGRVNFAGLGTPTRIVDMDSGEIRETTREDMIRHIILINACEHIHNSQMDVWPNDIPMHTIHSEAIWAWAHHSRKTFGMGCYGYRATLDMMEMMSVSVGGRKSLEENPRFMAICSVMSPLQMAQVQVEGLLICAAYRQPVAVSPEGIAGATAPATLAGLLAQENAAILAHITLAQIFNPGAPVLYGTVSTIANMRHGTVALGSVETGLITAASAQLARHYGLPCRSVGAATESKLPDLQAGSERTSTLLPAVLSGVNMITCGGTLDSTMIESDPLLLLDDELCGAMLRMRDGIIVDDEHLALDVIREVGYSGNYLAEDHTVRHYRKAHYLPKLSVRDPYDTWEKAGKPDALENAREKVREIIKNHEPQTLDHDIELALAECRDRIAQRPMDAFYAAEMAENQSWDEIL
jgi:trimethylamine--corrinoid protein Co-methyltransferase